jgi:hypothetical protein
LQLDIVAGVPDVSAAWNVRKNVEEYAPRSHGSSEIDS